MSEYSSTNKLQARTWDREIQELRLLNPDEMRALKDPKGWNTGMGLSFQMPYENELDIKVLDHNIATGVIIHLTWSNGKREKLVVGEDILEDKPDKKGVPYPIYTSNTAIPGQRNLKSIVAYENNKDKPEPERGYIIFNFPPPGPSNSLPVN